MTDFANKLTVSGTRSFIGRLLHGMLFWKYVALFVAVLSTALITNSLIETWFTYQEHRAALVRLQREQAELGRRPDFPVHPGDRKQSRLDHPSVLGGSGHGAA